MTPAIELRALFNRMHQEGAQRACASTFILNATFKVNGYHAQQSIIAAIASMGGEHAPLVRCQMMLEKLFALDKPDKIAGILKEYNKINRIPGFGSGFTKGEPDPIHDDINELLRKLDPKKHFYMVELHHQVQEQIDARLFPNTALYSAFTSILLNWSPFVLPGFAIEARMPVWNHILTKTFIGERDAMRDKEEARNKES